MKIRKLFVLVAGVMAIGAGASAWPVDGDDDTGRNMKAVDARAAQIQNELPQKIGTARFFHGQVEKPRYSDVCVVTSKTALGEAVLLLADARHAVEAAVVKQRQAAAASRDAANLYSPFHNVQAEPAKEEAESKLREADADLLKARTEVSALKRIIKGIGLAPEPGRDYSFGSCRDDSSHGHHGV